MILAVLDNAMHVLWMTLFFGEYYRVIIDDMSKSVDLATRRKFIEDIKIVGKSLFVQKIIYLLL